MACRKGGQIFVYPPEGITNAVQIRSGPPKCIVHKCRRRAPYRCGKLLCLQHCATEGDCLCPYHANPQGQGTKMWDGLIQDQIKAGRLHYGKGGKVMPGPKPVKWKGIKGPVPQIDKAPINRKP